MEAMSRLHVDTSNLSRSCNEALILGSLRGGPRHGYQLALEIEERSKGMFSFNHGTLYPILHRLEKTGLISGSWSQDGGGRRRKSYELTRKGEKHTRELLEAWDEFQDAFHSAVKGEGP
jgi:DNA-binding PadR family transcriptional regulator